MFEALLHEEEATDKEVTDNYSAKVAFQDALDGIVWPDVEQDDEEEAEVALLIEDLLLDRKKRVPVEFEDIPRDCLCCDLFGREECLFNLKDLYGRYLVIVSASLQFLYFCIGPAIRCEALELHEGKYANVLDLRGMLHMFFVKVRTERKRLYSKCRDAYGRDTWTGFVGEMTPMDWTEFQTPSHLYVEDHRREPYFRPGNPLSIEDAKWQTEHIHHAQFRMIGWKLDTIDRLLHDKVVRPLKRDHRRDENRTQMDFENFQNSLRLAVEAFTEPKRHKLELDAEGMPSFVSYRFYD